MRAIANLVFVVPMCVSVAALQAHDLAAGHPRAPQSASTHQGDSRVSPADSLSPGELLLTEKDLSAALASERSGNIAAAVATRFQPGGWQKNPIEIPRDREGRTSAAIIRSSATDYLLQVGAFREVAKADALRARIGFLGLTSRLDRREIAGRGYELYRVRLGPFENRMELERARETLRSAGVQSLPVSEIATR